MSAVISPTREALKPVRSAMEEKGHKLHDAKAKVNEQGVAIWFICCSLCGARTESVLFDGEVEVIRDTATVEQCKHNPDGRRFYL